MTKGSQPITRNQTAKAENDELYRLSGEPQARTTTDATDWLAHGVSPSKLSKRHPAHKVYPYLLRGVDIGSANQVWSTDITYMPGLKGHFYLVAVMDWFSRKVLSWQVSNTMDGYFCIEALEDALLHYHKPTIFNSDQGRSVHRKCFHRRSSVGACEDLDGWSRALLRRCFHRTVMAVVEV